MTLIESYTFDKCTNLESIYISSNITSIKEHSFEMCHNLKNIYYKGNKEDWNNINIDTSLLNKEPLVDDKDGYYGYYKENDCFNKYIIQETSSAKWHYNSSVSDEILSLI